MNKMSSTKSLSDQIFSITTRSADKHSWFYKTYQWHHLTGDEREIFKRMWDDRLSFDEVDEKMYQILDIPTGDPTNVQ